MPHRARASHARYEDAIRSTLTEVAGPDQAARLLQIAEELAPELESAPSPSPGSYLHAIAHMQASTQQTRPGTPSGTKP